MKPIRIQPGSNIFVAAMEVWDGEEFIVWLKNIGKFGVPYKMGMGLSLAGSIYFGSPRRSLLKPIRIQPGSNVFVAAMEVWEGEVFCVWTMIIGKFGVPQKTGIDLSRA